jgi:hypothetical protein
MVRIANRRRVAAVVVLGILLAGLGCGRETGPALVRVQGTVTLDGAPLPDGSLTFVGMATKAAAGGGTIKDGKFSFSLPAGAYRVQVFATRVVPGKTIPGMGDAPVRESIVPSRYNSATTLTAEVSREGEPLSFALKSQ